VEGKTKTKGARPGSESWTEFRGVYRLRSGAYGASIWDRSSRTQVWLGTFGTAQDAARAYDAARTYGAAAGKLPPARKTTARSSFRGVHRLSSGACGAPIWDSSSRTRVWLGTFGTVEDAARACAAARASGAAPVQLAGATKRKNEDRSKFRGVYRTFCGKYGALIAHSNGKARTWRTFGTPEDAARAYDAAAVKLHGARAITNFGPDSVAPGTRLDDLSTADWQQAEELLKNMESTDVSQ
jgi:hypothetical protein